MKMKILLRDITVIGYFKNPFSVDLAQCRMRLVGVTFDEAIKIVSKHFMSTPKKFEIIINN